jgi:hypothetical protein
VIKLSGSYFLLAGSELAERTLHSNSHPQLRGLRRTLRASLLVSSEPSLTQICSPDGNRSQRFRRDFYFRFAAGWRMPPVRRTPEGMGLKIQLVVSHPKLICPL